MFVSSFSVFYVLLFIVHSLHYHSCAVFLCVEEWLCWWGEGIVVVVVAVVVAVVIVVVVVVATDTMSINPSHPSTNTCLSLCHERY